MGGRGCRTMGGGGRAGVGTGILQLSLELHTMIQDWSTYWEASFSMRSISASMSGGRSSSHATSISRAHALAQNETKLRMHNFVCIRSGQGGHWYRKPLWAAFRNISQWLDLQTHEGSSPERCGEFREFYTFLSRIIRFSEERPASRRARRHRYVIVSKLSSLTPTRMEAAANTNAQSSTTSLSRPLNHRWRKERLHVKESYLEYFNNPSFTKGASSQPYLLSC